MPNTPAQFPNFDLPGAEWFGLAPNAQISIQGRRRKAFSTDPAGTVIPANAAQPYVQVAGLLEQPFGQNAGVYVHHFWVDVLPFNPGLLITNAGIGLSLRTVISDPDKSDFVLGYPALPSQALSAQQTVVAGGDTLVTQRDIAMGTLAPPYPGVIADNLTMKAAVGVLNSTSNPIAMILVARIVYTRLDGFTE